jgi:hypothetical protein
MVEHELPKLGARVRFPSPAPQRTTRILSWWWDYLVILAWLASVFVVAGLPQLLGWWDLSAVWSDQTASDIAITLLTVVPYLTYLVIAESGPTHATLGKRRVGVMVTSVDGNEPGRGSIVVRNLIKVLPWQLGHMGTMRLISSIDPPPPAIWFEAASLLVLALMVGPVLFGRPGIHEIVSGSRVTSATAGASPEM